MLTKKLYKLYIIIPHNEHSLPAHSLMGHDSSLSELISPELHLLWAVISSYLLNSVCLFDRFTEHSCLWLITRAVCIRATNAGLASAFICICCWGLYVTLVWPASDPWGVADFHWVRKTKWQHTQSQRIRAKLRMKSVTQHLPVNLVLDWQNLQDRRPASTSLRVA